MGTTRVMHGPRNRNQDHTAFSLHAAGTRIEGRGVISNLYVVVCTTITKNAL